MKHSGLILFGHGSRDPRWAEPLHYVQKLIGVSQPGLPVKLAFLELMTPTLPEAVQALADDSVTAIQVIPFFLGQGGHVRRDLPDLIAEIQQRHPQLSIRLAPAVGESTDVLQAIRDYCLLQL